METIEFQLPVFWAVALINGDTSHMDEEEITGLDHWLAHELPDGFAHVDICDDEHFARWHDASRHVLACNVATFTFYL